MTLSVSPCTHCHRRDATVRLCRIPLVGVRPLCTQCRDALNALGMDIREAA